jgi:hypothetical protein
MFNNGARSQTTQNLNKLFNRELSDRRNVYLCLVAIALVIGGSGGCMASRWVTVTDPVVEGNPENNRQLANASTLPAIQTSDRGEVVPTDREELISQVWQCQLTWIARVERPETLSTDDLNKLLEQCKAARSGGDS